MSFYNISKYNNTAMKMEITLANPPLLAHTFNYFFENGVLNMSLNGINVNFVYVRMTQWSSNVH